MFPDTTPLLEFNEWLPVPLDLGGGRALHSRVPDIWPVVLEARFVPCLLHQGAEGVQLLVPPERFRAAVDELRLFEEENRNWPPSPPPVRYQEQNTLATVSILLLIAIFHNLTLLKSPLPGVGTVDWTDVGSARANLIAGGDWWRAVTALTLHSGIVHLSSNLLVGGAMMVFLCREVGSGLAWSLAVAAGFLGNVANAHAQMPTHVSVGASTAVFGVIGILASLNMIRYRHVARKWILPVAAGLALLVALGTEGERTDLGAHFFGFLAGIVLGVVASPLGRVPKPANAVLAFATAAAVVVAWWLAIAAP